ncbi:MAG: VOC family protein [Gammaproteobacteria bacterium]
MWACADLDRGMQAMAEMTGVAPAPGGPHPGFGTRNALADLGRQRYLEIIAPDPEQALENNLGGELSRLEAPYLRTWAIRVDDLTSTRDSLGSLGFDPRGPTAMSRALPSGELISWELLFLSHEDYIARSAGSGQLGSAGVLPFFIDWKSSPHPCTNLEPGCALETLQIETPEPSRLERLAEEFALDVGIRAGASDRLRATLSTPRGTVVLD